MLVEVSDHGLRTRQNVVVRDETRWLRAWGSVHDRANGRMLFLHVVERGLDEPVGRACSDLLVEWAVGQAHEVGAAPRPRGPADRHRRLRGRRAAAPLAGRGGIHAGPHLVADEAAGHPRRGELVDDPARWERDGVVVRLVECATTDDAASPVEADLRAVHDVLEAAFTDHFNSKPETFDEFLFRLREDPGHRWDHWWLAEVDGRPAGRAGRHDRVRRPGPTSPTSASSSWPAAAASPRGCCAP